MKKRVVLIINLESEKNIAKGEKEKTTLENQGYKLVDSSCGFSTVYLAYEI
jgi:uncharacterized protein YcgL (UPF0745 family)